VNDLNELKAIIFDVDGVLVDTEALVSRAAARLFGELGVSVSPHVFQAHVGSGPERYLALPAEEAGLELDLESAVDRLDELFLEESAAGVPRFPGAVAMLSLARDYGLKRAVATSAHRAKLERNLAAFGLSEENLDAVVSCEAVSRNKPAPDIYLYCAEQLGLKPEECLVVEDSMNGVKAAVDAGMPCIAVANTFHERFLIWANRVFGSTLELAHQLERQHWREILNDA